MPAHEPQNEPQSSLVDLLDRVLDRGLVIDADIIISLAGVPLVGLRLRAALAGMETMVRYGVMTEWDTRIRQQHRETLAHRVIDGSQELGAMGVSHFHRDEHRIESGGGGPLGPPV